MEISEEGGRPMAPAKTVDNVEDLYEMLDLLGKGSYSTGMEWLNSKRCAGNTSQVFAPPTTCA